VEALDLGADDYVKICGPPAHTSGAEYLRVYIDRLRRKLHATRENPIIETEQGVGYRLKA